jgi:hypothetical protein
MDFPILEITDEALAEPGRRRPFHPNGLGGPHGGAGVDHARPVGPTRRRHVPPQRGRPCEKVDTVDAGTVWAHKPLRPTQVLLLVPGLGQGEASAALARELARASDPVPHGRPPIQRKALRVPPERPLPEAVTETDESFQKAGANRRTTA